MKCVNLETAKGLKELGYKTMSLNSYVQFKSDGDETWHFVSYDDNVYFHSLKNGWDSFIYAPRLDDASYFLRDEYKFDICVKVDRYEDEILYCGYVSDFSKKGFIDTQQVSKHKDPIVVLEETVKYTVHKLLKKG